MKNLLRKVKSKGPALIFISRHLFSCYNNFKYIIKAQFLTNVIASPELPVIARRFMPKQSPFTGLLRHFVPRNDRRIVLRTETLQSIIKKIGTVPVFKYII